MTPKKKAEALIDRFIQQTRNRYDRISISHIRAKQCALIAIDEMLKVTPKYYTDELLTPKGSTDVRITNCTYEYLEQVKKEIINH